MSITPSEAEILRAVEKAAEQFNEYTRLAELASYQKVSEFNSPTYTWDNPIGLVVTERSNGNLV